MRKILLKIENLESKVNGKEILKGINLQIKEGEVVALLGPNGSGKSVMAQTILGNPKYKVTRGKIFFRGKEITKLAPEKRAKLGIALSWQSPPTIKGIKLSYLCSSFRNLKNSEMKTCSSFRNLKNSEMKTCSKIGSRISENLAPAFLTIKEAEGLLEREVNVGFSGGEKKISELLQILSLNPKLVIFDEIDSGLDIKKLERVAEIIKKELLEKNVSVLLITHLGQILNFLKPQLVNVLVDGRIICKAKNFLRVSAIIKKYGYEKCKKCQSDTKFLAN